MTLCTLSTGESIKRLRAAGNNDAELYIIKNAGHHLYLDNYASSNQMMRKAFRKQAADDARLDRERANIKAV